MSPHTNFHAPRTSLSGRIQIGHKSGYLFYLSVNIKPLRHRFGFSLAWGWQNQNFSVILYNGCTSKLEKFYIPHDTPIVGGRDKNFKVLILWSRYISSENKSFDEELIIFGRRLIMCCAVLLWTLYSLVWLVAGRYTSNATVNPHCVYDSWG